MNSKILGGILLIVGTSIGGGMLALPVANADVGFAISSALLILSWAVMTFCSFLILEANLWFSPGCNLISMANATLGKAGKIIAWLCTLSLLYALLAAYIAGGNDVFQDLLQRTHLNLAPALSAVLFTLLLGLIVYQGIASVDYVNRGLMFAKLGAYLLLVGLLIPYVNFENIRAEATRHALGPIMVMITSFGFAVIIPSLREYFHDDVKKLRYCVLVGTLIPLVFYILWDAVIMGVIPRFGSDGLLSMLKSGHSTSDLTRSLDYLLNNNTIGNTARFFTSICMLTAFLGVGISLFDFLADGLHFQKKGLQKIGITISCFLPPLLITLFYPNIFISALNYAGIICVVLLTLLPTLMVYSGRCVKRIAQGYQVWGNKLALQLMIIIAVLLLIIGFIS